MPLPDFRKLVSELPPPMRPFFAPLVKSALGLAVGIVMAWGLFLLAVYHRLFVTPTEGLDLFVWLLGHNFFPGYAPSLPGALIGVFWGLTTGFIIGWLLAFIRNRMIVVCVFVIWVRERLRASMHVLDDLN